ncbi:hypothetical protein [Aquimarina sp. MAR_2010_214]|uniref:hypothetical protein n=1 Tax=Aquimarina sp. MAR_2010_214 TaxID=1250026 RepID=UPI001177FC3A|nr:hypothetical protein [Aquimarina sp. MAR_2010_214]
MSDLKLKDQETATKNKKAASFEVYIGTFLIVLSGVILYLDKIFQIIGFSVDIQDDYYDFTTFIWVMCQSISPLIIILVLGTNLKPLRISYTIPLYCYCLQIYYIFFDLDVIDDKHYTPYYAIVTTILMYFIMVGLRLLFNYWNSLKQTEIEILQSIVDSDEVLLKENGIILDEELG